MSAISLPKLPAIASSPVATEVLNGLTQRPKTLSPWLFYDQKGSQLFEEITELPEYYVTRTERQILAEHAEEIVTAAAGGRDLSMIELGLYESTIKVYNELAERGIEAHSEEWNRAIKDTLERQREAMRPRLFPELPKHRYLCFYPMDRRRGEDKNWYTVPIEERARQMNEHGLVGRRYAGEVKQIITGSIGFDDWEWGVDLFADDPLVFKKLIYEMRFDEVSAVYALFGTFYVGLRCGSSELGKLLSGQVPRG